MQHYRRLRNVAVPLWCLLSRGVRYTLGTENKPSWKAGERERWVGGIDSQSGDRGWGGLEVQHPCWELLNGPYLGCCQCCRGMLCSPELLLLKQQQPGTIWEFLEWVNCGVAFSAGVHSPWSKEEILACLLTWHLGQVPLSLTPSYITAIRGSDLQNSFKMVNS